MAQYHYDGSMAAYFVLTFLSLVLFPLSYSIIPVTSRKPTAEGCQCPDCLEHRENVRLSERPTLLRPKLSKTAVITLLGWILFAVTAYKVANTAVDNVVYDPFAILGIKSSATEKEIKKHYKRLSVKFHPDKVKPGVNETLEAIQDHFVNLTKAYKSLTDETIRKNFELYGHPDGRQEFSMGIAIPQFIIESKNNIWVLGLYGIVFGIGLPILVGRWWFGSRNVTKDGVHARTAELFFKSIKEDMGETDIVLSVGNALPWEIPVKPTKASVSAVHELRQQIESRVGREWERKVDTESPQVLRALTLVYAHLLRLPIENSHLRQEQKALLLHVPSLLNSLLNIAIAHSWLLPTVRTMHIHQHLAQAILPGAEKMIQFPGITDTFEDLPDSLEGLIERLEETGDQRLDVVKKAGEKWGKLEVVDASYKVIGERFVSPGAIVQLVFKLRLCPPIANPELPNGTLPDVDKEKRDAKFNDERDHAFLVSKKDLEDLPAGELLSGWAHAPRWPVNRRPRWWAVLGDDKSNRVVVPPLQVSDLPFADPHKTRNYRTFKMQFQAPQGVGLYTWRIHFISDTFVGEDVSQDLTLKVEDLSLLNEDEQHEEDQISDPEEDTLAGQMAAMRGGGVKKVAYGSDESSTDDDEEAESESSDDSD
ncbi:Sec63 Brl domain-containing protein [Gautieria morchelliformis]|nr:Sec63 Brl domain-containing protein [Gautieria morchelliformis]